MENSYFRSPYNPIRHFPRPHHHNHDLPQQSPKTVPVPSSKPKVVSIPVHFVESVAESNRRNSAAIRIQSHLRGFLVRRKVEAVRRIEAEVDEIERRIQRDLQDLLLRDEKERIRTNEMLMALLLRLDSVRGVRDYRRKVIRRAIMLQETVDSLSSSSAAKPLEETGGKPLQDQEEAVMEVQETPETDRDRELPEDTELEINETTTDQETPEGMLVNQGGGEAVLEVHETNQETLENTRDEGGMKDEEIGTEEGKKTKTGEDEEIPFKEIGVVDDKASFPMEEDNERSMMEEKDESAAVKLEKSEEKENSEELGLKSVMERMVVENQNLKALVAELCERSSLQCKLMGGLAKRVAQLEKTVQNMEKKKRKKKESK